MPSKEKIKFPAFTGRKKYFIIAGIIVALAASIWAFSGSKEKEVTADDYLTVAVRKGNITNSLDGTGVLEPSQREALSTKVDGTIKQILVNEGDEVEKGQMLMEVYNNEAVSRARQAELEWKIAKDAYEEMIDSGAADDHDIKAAELKVEQYEIQLDEYKLDKENLFIKPSFDGKIIDLNVRKGEKVTVGKGLGSFATANAFEVVASFSDKDVAALNEGMKVSTSVNALSRSYSGRIKEISYKGTATTESSTKTSALFEVIISLDAVDEDLRSGMETRSTVFVVQDSENETYIYKYASGYLRHVETEEITSEVTGTVVDIYYQEGDQVKSGETIIRISNDDIDRQVRVAENLLDQAKEDLSKLLSPDDDDIWSQELKMEQAYEKVLSAQADVNSLNVISPINGTVIDISAEENDEIKADQEIIVVSNFNKNKLVISVDELDINKIKLGQAAIVEVDALPNQRINGEVTDIDYEGSASNGVTSYDITIEVDKADGIKAGMTATATIFLERKENVLLIPAEALNSTNGRETVTVMVDGQATMKRVTTGTNNGTFVEISEGLAEGDQIVIAATAAQQANIRIPGMGGAGRPPGGSSGQQRNTNNR